MLKAEDRLKEAEFFLEKLKTTNGKGKEFRYYLSALVSATRSITLVLQKDLRSEYGDVFDKWWEQKKGGILVSPVSFEDIRKLRNILQKEGHKLLHVYRAEDEHEGVIIEKAVDLFNLDDAGTLKISFSDLPSLSRMTDETDEEFEERILEETKQFAFSKILSVANRLTELNLYSAGVEWIEGELYDFETLVSGFENYLSSMRKLIDEANLAFKRD